MEQRAYYSRSAGYQCLIDPGINRVDSQGQTYRDGERIIAFSPIGQSGHGVYFTDNPKDIEVLDKLVGNGTLMTEIDYNKATIPLAEQLRAADTERARLMTENNKLLQMLSQQGRKPANAAA